MTWLYVLGLAGAAILLIVVVAVYLIIRIGADEPDVYRGHGPRL